MSNKPTETERDLVRLVRDLIKRIDDPWSDPQVKSDLDDRLTEWIIYNDPENYT